MKEGMSPKKVLSADRVAKMQAARVAGGGKRKSANGHTVRSRDHGTVTFEKYGRKLAAAALCTECLGFEGDPKDCTSRLCPMYPFRARTRATAHSNNGDGVAEKVKVEEDGE